MKDTIQDRPVDQPGANTHDSRHGFRAVPSAILLISAALPAVAAPGSDIPVDVQLP
jgi:hypothetical protein